MALSDDVIPVLVERVPFTTGSSPQQSAGSYLSKFVSEGFQLSPNVVLVYAGRKLLPKQAVTYCRKSMMQ